MNSQHTCAFFQKFDDPEDFVNFYAEEFEAMKPTASLVKCFTEVLTTTVEDNVGVRYSFLFHIEVIKIRFALFQPVISAQYVFHIMLELGIEGAFKEKKSGVVFADLTAACDTVFHGGVSRKAAETLPDKHHMVRMVM